ncbi:hypothetical protein C8R42DRAFT_724176 [Lentinula raphanica]|nr:hypothetical protein C8R42DRAFT_724176 [Lentinula raphanica]
MHPSNFAAILQCLYATSFSQAMFSSHLHSDVPSAQSFQKSSRSIESGLNAGIEDIAGSPLSISKGHITWYYILFYRLTPALQQIFSRMPILLPWGDPQIVSARWLDLYEHTAQSWIRTKKIES